MKLITGGAGGVKFSAPISLVFIRLKNSSSA
jgi:hypothetical protein